MPPGECTVLGPAGWWKHRTSFFFTFCNCPLDRVLTYKNLIYLLVLDFNASIIQAAAKAMEHLTDFVFFSMGNLTLACRDACMSHLRTASNRIL